MTSENCCSGVCSRYKAQSKKYVWITVDRDIRDKLKEIKGNMSWEELFQSKFQIPKTEKPTTFKKMKLGIDKFRCSICNIYLVENGTIIIGNRRYCACCRYLVRTKSRYKKKSLIIATTNTNRSEMRGKN